jgi:hypothetical protein
LARADVFLAVRYKDFFAMADGSGGLDFRKHFARHADVVKDQTGVSVLVL